MSVRKKKIYLELDGMSYFVVQQMIITNVNKKIGTTFGNIWRYFKCTIISKQCKGKYSIFAGIIIVNTRYVRIVENQSRPL